ncbi:hypothetical protein [Kingella potus]|uniref:hypothetical protein n=1 Tax=Kingella potus TaxID=265175 RepID=UPI001FD2F017|nr:hypothetical protein [Kingella potus]UOP01260.1 hypothetical protein LVJ84_03080 [Kingella potus]
MRGLHAHLIRIADAGCVAPRRTRSLPQLKSPQRKGRLKAQMLFSDGLLPFLHTRLQYGRIFCYAL